MSDSLSLISTHEVPEGVEAVVAMAVYSGDKIDWVEQATKSILEQEFDNFVFVIIADGPVCADLFQYLINASKFDNRLLIASNEENHGLSVCMNLIAEYVMNNFPKVEFFFRMDADDISIKQRLARQIAFFKQHPEVSVLGTSLLEVNEKGKVVGKRRLPQSHEQIAATLTKRCAINHPTVGIRMQVFQSGFRYNPNLRNTQDYFLWIDLCAAGFIFANLPDILLKFRRVNDFYKRRGLDKSINEFNARFYAMKCMNRYKVANIIYAFAVIILRLMPPKLIKLAYKVDRYLLGRRKYK